MLYVELNLCQPLSEQELLTAHANILALGDRYGISYKDAVHQLYIAQIEKVKESDEAFKSIKRIDDELEGILRSISGELEKEQ